MSSDDEARKREGAAVDRTVGALGGLILGALASATYGPEGVAVAPVLAAASAPWLEEMNYLARVAITRRSSRAQHAISIASQTAHLQPEQLLRSLLNDDDLVELMARVIESAASTTLSAKVAALGRSLGQAASDHTRIDIEILIVDALSSLESPDIRMLAALTERAPHSRDRGPGLHVASGGHGRPNETDDPLWTTWTYELFTQENPKFGDAAKILAARLTALGLISRQSGWFSNGESMRVNDFGHLILMRLHAEGLD